MNLRTTYISPSVKNVLGFSQVERMHQTLNEQLTPNSLSLVLDVLSKELTLEKQGNADPNRKIAIELEYYHKDGSTRWMDLVISGIHNDQGVLTSIHGVSRNITERKRAEDALKESENKYRLLADNIQDVVFVMDMNLNYTYLSPSVKILRGYEPEEAMKHTPEETMTPSSIDLALGILSEMMEMEKSEHRNINISQTAQLEMTRKDGTTVWVETKASFIRDENHRPVGIMGLTRDITERKKVEDALRESEYKYKGLIENIPDIIFTIDLEGKITFVSKRAKEISGYENAEMINKNIFNFIPEEAHLSTMEKLQEGMKGKKIKHIQMPVIAKSGEKLFFEFSFSRIYKDEAVVGAQGTAVDITKRKKAEDELRESELRYQKLSIIDDLTQLYNSRHFYAQLEREIERSNRYEQPLTLLLLDLDKFKDFNDTYGHVEGDHVLSRLGQVVKRCLRETDSAYRYGGEEFTIILPMTTRREGIVTAKRIQAELSKESFSPALGQEVYVTVSIGMAQYKPKEEIRAFVNRVDLLMYQAKNDGRDRICPES
jgi:diguanylate cyclase (GGDEF)-like protein/PAS domain S-box-containing protein